jgi:GNAT superfamily N-acetyltransferase
MEQRHGAYVISDDAARLDPVAIHAYLSRSYWSPNIPLETVQRALKNSISVGAYLVSGPSSSAKPTDDKQVGLVRIITDCATYAYLCDVYVLEEHRGHGLAKALMALTMALPQLQGLRSWNLRTRDAHPLYAQFGFKVIDNPGGYMIHRPASG